MAQSEGAATSPSAGGGGDSRDDGFVPVPKDEPLSPPPVRAPTAFVTDPIRPRAVARPFKTTTPIPRLSTAPPPRVSQPSVKKVTSRFFSKATPESASDGAPLAARGDAPAVRRGGKMRRSHASLPDAVADARAALEDFRAAAAKKNAHKDHGDAAESVLIPFRPFVDARIAAHADAASGEVLFVRETTTTRDEDDDFNAFADRARTRLAIRPTTASKSLRLRAADSHLPGAEAAGKVLSSTLTELDRLHVNASCRVRQRAPAVATARARLTQLRRECRDAFGALDPAGLLARTEASRAAKRALPAARDAAYFASGRSQVGSIDELRDQCPLFASTRSPHHLCLHLCYYREYDPARQLFVLRTRCAAAKGSAAELDGWRAELALAPSTEAVSHRGEKNRRRRRRRGVGDGSDESDDDFDDTDDDDDDDDGAGDEGVGDDDVIGVERSVARKRPRVRRRRTKRRAIEDGGWLAGDALPWRVRFVSPEGEHFHDGAQVLARLGVDALGAGPAAANANGGGGLGNETLDDFDWAGAAAASAEIVGSPGTRVAGLGSPPAASRRGPGPRARGQVAPAPRRLDLGLGAVRSTHGGSGVRLARPEESGLDQATDLLRASLWPASADDAVGTTPVRHRRVAAAAGEPRSPFRLAPDPFEVPGGGSDQTEQPVLEEEQPSSVDWWSPPRSPFGLLEEILWSDEWKLLVACMMLNCTTRLQVDRVLWRLFLLVPTPEDAVALGALGDGGNDGFDGKSGLDRIEEILRPLGLHRKRARALVKLSEDYVAARGAAALPGPPGATGSDDDDDDGGGGRGSLGGFFGSSRRLGAPVASLHGVGAYASDAHAMFCEGTLGVAPRDHALRWWYAWALERRESERRERRAARG